MIIYLGYVYAVTGFISFLLDLDYTVCGDSFVFILIVQVDQDERRCLIGASSGKVFQIIFNIQKPSIFDIFAFETPWSEQQTRLW